MSLNIMNKQTKLKTIVAVAFLSTASLCSMMPAQAAEHLMPAIPSFRTAQVDKLPSIQVATALPKIAAELPIYSIQQIPDSKEYMTKVATTLGLDGKLLRNGKGKLAMRNRGGDIEQQTLTMFEASGGFFYRYNKQLNAVPKEQPALPSKEEAYNIALEYLQKQGFLPNDAVIDPKLVDFSMSRLVEFDGKSGKNIREFVTSIEVRFPQLWGGKQLVTGPGSKLYVAIGNQGKVLGVTKMWRQATATKSVLKTITPTSAINALRSNQGHLSTPAGCSVAEINDMKLVYWSQSPSHIQRTSIPVYSVSGLCYNDSGLSLGEFEAYAPAVLNANLRLNTRKQKADYDQDNDI